MPLNDNTGSAGRMSSSFRGGSASSTIFGSQQDVDELIDYAIAKVRRETKKVQKESFRSMEKGLKDFEKSLKKATSLKEGLFESLDRFTGGFAGAVRSFREASSAYNKNSNSKKNKEALLNAANKVGSVVGQYVEKAVKFVAQQYAQYAKVYESTIKTVGTNLGMGKSGYSNLVSSSQSYLNRTGYSGVVSSQDTMQSMAKLTQIGITSNLETLSALEAMSDRISSTWDASIAAGNMRLFGSDSGAYELALGTEVAIRKGLQEQFGDTQFIQNGMYKATVNQLSALWKLQSNAEESYELQVNMLDNISKIYESGYSDANVNDFNEQLSYLSKGQYDKLDPYIIDMINKSGMSMADFRNASTVGAASEKLSAQYQSYMSGYSDMVGNDLWLANSLGQVLGIPEGYELTTEMQKSIEERRKSAEARASSSDYTVTDIYSALDGQIEIAKSQLTVQEKINKWLENATGTMGGATVSQLGSGLINGIGNIGGVVLGGLAVKGVTKLISGKLGGGTGLVGKLLGGGGNAAAGASGASKLGSLFTTAGKSGVSGFLSSTGAKVLGGVGGGIAMLADGASAVSNKTYGESGFGNAIGGALMGNQKGWESGFGNVAMGLLGNTAKGAAIGTMFGPIGTAIGAGVGLIGGIVGNFIASAKNKKANQTEEAKAAEASSSSKGSYNDILNSINTNITLQSQQIVTAMTNIYLLLADHFGSATATAGVTAGEFIKK